jgi:protein involved in sex pheromone biosynthesis
LKKLVVILSLALLLSGCVPLSGDQEGEIIQGNETENKDDTAIIPKFQISDSYYKTLSPFKPSDARGLTVSRLHTRLDSDEMEEGLLRIAQETFPTDTYFFQEGQYLDRKTVSSWLGRQTEENSLGLNPSIENKHDANQNKENPIYLAHILEHNFLTKSGEESVKLSGLAIGLAMNSVHYYETEEGYPRELAIPHEQIVREGKRIADSVVTRLRQIEGLEEIPITIGLFKQRERTAIIPGNYFAFGTTNAGGSTLDWTDINEEYVLFPSSAGTEKYRDDATQFQLFQQDVQQYFPNYNGIVGTGYYINNDMQKITIDINIQFYGKAEVIGFAQYVGGLLMETFNPYVTIEVRVSSIKGQEALILREANMEEPVVHIY